MAAADGPCGADHNSYGEPMGEGDAYQTGLTVDHLVGSDGAHTDEDQGERADKFRNQRF